MARMEGKWEENGRKMGQPSSPIPLSPFSQGPQTFPPSPFTKRGTEHKPAPLQVVCSLSQIKG